VVQHLLADVGGHVRRLLTRPGEELSLLHRTASFWLRLSWSCATKLRRDNAPQVAAALSFQTLFSLIPMLVLILVFFDSVVGLEPVAERVRATVVDFLLPEGLISAEAAPLTAESPTSDEFNEARELVRSRIDDMLDRLSHVSFAGVGVVGLLAFLYGTTALMSTIEASFNSIYQAEETRPLRVRLPLYFTVVAVGPIAIAAAQILRDQLLEKLAATPGGGSRLAGFLASLAPLIAAWLVLLLLYRLVPNTRVRWGCAAAGAFVTALAWILFQGLFGLYLSNTFLTSLYGALALIPLFLLWVYWSWMLTLFGLGLSFSLQYLSLGEAAWRPPFPGDPRWFVPIMRAVAEAFRDGKTIGVTDLSRRCQLPPGFLRPYLRTLEREQLIRRTRESDGQRVVLMARPANTVKVREILGLEPLANGTASGELARQLEAGQLDAVGDLTLRDLLRPPVADVDD
jgi:membrane protein